MRTDKDFKRLVRGRRRTTGESYTAARAHLLKKRTSRSAGPRAPSVVPVHVSTATPQPAVADYAGIAGMSDAAVKAKTGCTWERWVMALDHVGAHQWPHSTIARYMHDKYQAGDWWAQMVAVGYERIRGLRDRAQRRSGAYEALKSRTVAAPVGKLFKAVSQPRLRSQWLPDVKLAVRQATPNRSIRITWEDGTSVTCWFVAKGRSKSAVQLSHGKLRTRDDVARMKQYWTERLDALAQLLAPARRTAG
jgi:uncharacterized protein YndB with AHSA1/START domain